MQIYRVVMSVIAALCLSLAAAAEAQQSGGQTVAQQGMLFSTETVVGSTVRNVQGEEVGDVKSLLFDDQGRVAYAVIGVGGFLGMGEKTLVVPWKALQVKQEKDGEGLVMNATKQLLAEAPSAREEELAQRERGEEIHRYYGVDPYWQTAARRPESTTGAQMPAQVSATVEEINQDNRKATFKTEGGQTVELTVTEQLLQNLQQGDNVFITLRKVERSQ